ncbi:protein of unknown function [Cyanobium sp. NIES-981]|nr:protein of unknown function [Cyanobium sp. NIES-981]SBO44990.1 protein of unknown function [Cyanobium sp. NIES-981]
MHPDPQGPGSSASSSLQDHDAVEASVPKRFGCPGSSTSTPVTPVLSVDAASRFPAPATQKTYITGGLLPCGPRFPSVSPLTPQLSLLGRSPKL